LKPRIAPPTLLALFPRALNQRGNKAHLMSPARIWNAGIVFQQFTRFCQDISGAPRRSVEGGPGRFGLCARFARCRDGIPALLRRGSHTGESGSCTKGQALAPKANGSAGLETASGRRGDGPETQRAWLSGFGAANDGAESPDRPIASIAPPGATLPSPQN